jgi:hypothetical protein
VSPRFCEITIGTYGGWGGGGGKANGMFEFKTIQGVCMNKATQRTTMKRCFYWHACFIKYVITVIVRDEVVNKAWLDVRN